MEKIMTDLQRDLQRNFLFKLNEAGSQAEFARQSGLDQGRIAKILSGKIRFGNLTLETLERLFPGQLNLAPPPVPGCAPMQRRIRRICNVLNEEELTELLLLLATHFPNRVQ